MSETQPFKSHGLFLLWHSLMALIHNSLVSGEGACKMNISAPPIFLIHTAHLHGSLSTVSVWPRPFVYTTETWYFRAVSLKQIGSAWAAWCVCWLAKNNLAPYSQPIRCRGISLVDWLKNLVPNSQLIRNNLSPLARTRFIPTVSRLLLQSTPYEAALPHQRKHIFNMDWISHLPSYYAYIDRPGDLLLLSLVH